MSLSILSAPEAHTAVLVQGFRAQLVEGLTEQAIKAIMPDIRNRVEIIVDAMNPTLLRYADCMRDQTVIRAVFQVAGKAVAE